MGSDAVLYSTFLNHFIEIMSLFIRFLHWWTVFMLSESRSFVSTTKSWSKIPISKVYEPKFSKGGDGSEASMHEKDNRRSDITIEALVNVEVGPFSCQAT